jgi:hypothetical protein
MWEKKANESNHALEWEEGGASEDAGKKGGGPTRWNAQSPGLVRAREKVSQWVLIKERGAGGKKTPRVAWQGGGVARMVMVRVVRERPRRT